MEQASDVLTRIRATNEKAEFNRWCRIEVISAAQGSAVIAMPWRAEASQYSGFLHAGIVGALIDTACGFAAVTLVEGVLASHYAINFLRPAVGHRFIARAKVVKPGKSQMFTACELYAESDGAEKLVATGETLLLVIGNESAAS